MARRVGTALVAALEKVYMVERKEDIAARRVDILV